MKLSEEKLKALVLLDLRKEEKYHEALVQFFREIDPLTIRLFLLKYESNRNKKILTIAAIISEKFDFDETLELLEEINFQDSMCAKIISNKKLTYPQMKSLLVARIQKLESAVGIGPLIERIIDTEILTGPNLMDLFQFCSENEIQIDSYVEYATDQIKRYIESEEE